MSRGISQPRRNRRTSARRSPSRPRCQAANSRDRIDASPVEPDVLIGLGRGTGSCPCGIMGVSPMSPPRGTPSTAEPAPGRTSFPRRSKIFGLAAGVGHR